MKNRLAIVFIFLLISIGNLHAQNLFAEKFDGCTTDQFALESDTATAKIDGKELIRVITEGFHETVESKIDGVLALQIIVDKEGRSCLISLKNDTNVKTKKLNLKETIDERLTWEKPAQTISAIVVLKFANHQVLYKRLGTNDKKGIHELELN